MNNECRCCGGQLGVLGQLGRLVWLLCRNCGMQFSVDASEYDEGDIY